MSEEQLRSATAPTPSSPEELAEFVALMAKRDHTYGTCVYSMSLSAVAAFNYVSHTLGVTGFQASCADLDILRRTRGLECGRIQNFQDLLFPQYRDKFADWDALIAKNAEWLAGEAKKLLADRRHAPPSVVAHWEMLAKAGGGA